MLTATIAGQRRMPFGKYRGEKLADIAGCDRPYLEWLADTHWVNGDLRAAARLVLRGEAEEDDA